MKPDRKTSLPRPLVRPRNTHFSSGPTSKRPEWSLQALEKACLGRSHRSSEGKEKLNTCITMMRDLLGLPDEYYLGIVPASDTGAVEMAMWSLLGARGVDIFAWEAFGKTWLKDAVDQLQLSDIRVFEAPYGRLPDLGMASPDRDVILTWNGTAAGVRVPDADWIADDRDGLIIADSTSAVFAFPMPVEKLDVITFSWQKSLGGEGAHGVIVLSPRAVARLESHQPAWPVPKIFQLTKNNVLARDIFAGATINTPSMLCVEDALDALKWAQDIGGRDALFQRVEANFKAISTWILHHPDLAFLAEDPATISPTSVTIRITADWFTKAEPAKQKLLAKKITALLDEEDVARDIDSYRDAPPGLRIWAGPTVETRDLEALFPWIDWALAIVRDEVQHENSKD
ncbi:phosphoserine transaminase [Alphaproteobacteria bacterium LSUCC0684]